MEVNLTMTLIYLVPQNSFLTFKIVGPYWVDAKQSYFGVKKLSTVVVIINYAIFNLPLNFLALVENMIFKYQK